MRFALLLIVALGIVWMAHHFATAPARGRLCGYIESLPWLQCAKD